MPEPKMTVSQFMKELAKHAGKFKMVTYYNSKAYEYYEVIRAGCNSRSACPITKVYSARQNKPCGAKQYEQAGKELGLNRRTRDVIVRAADNASYPTRRAKEVRKQMLKVLGLKETA